MDDFGSGYSSLYVLKDANVDYLKLDMKFMQIDAKNKGKGIQILKSMNCNYGQGFYFHRPMSVEAAEELIQTIPIETSGPPMNRSAGFVMSANRSLIPRKCGS